MTRVIVYMTVAYLVIVAILVLMPQNKNENRTDKVLVGGRAGIMVVDAFTVGR